MPLICKAYRNKNKGSYWKIPIAAFCELAQIFVMQQKRGLLHVI